MSSKRRHKQDFVLHAELNRNKDRGVTTKLYIGNLPDLCRKEELEAKFKKYGNVVEFDIVSNYGFAHYETASEAKAAADALNGTDYNGNSLKVELSHSRVRQKPGMGDKEGCFRCGQEGHWSKDCPRGPRRPRPPPGGYRDPYEEDSYYRDPYADSYMRGRYMPPPPPSYSQYEQFYDPYDRRPLPPPPRDPYMRERMSDPYARPHPDYYARRSPTLGAPGAASRDPYEKNGPYGAPRAADPYAGKDAYGKDPYAAPQAREAYNPTRDPYEDYYERRRAYAASVRTAPYPKPTTGSASGVGSYNISQGSVQSSRVPGPY